MPKQPVSNYDKDSLIDDLKLAGFEDAVAEIIAARVDGEKAKDWTYDMGRQEALRQATLLLEGTHMALDNFRSSTPRTARSRTERLAERIADPGMLKS